MQNVIRGPDFQSPLPEESLGIQVYNKLRTNNPRRILFIDGFTDIRKTNEEFLRNTCRLSISLIKGLHLNSSDIIGVCSENNLYFMEVMVAALYTGICIAPVNYTYTEGELHHVINISKPSVIFCSKASHSKLITLMKQLTYIRKLIVFDHNEAKTDDSIDYTDFINKHTKPNFDFNRFKPIDVDTHNHVATILCSSGTTGLPKGVMLTHRNITVRIMHTIDGRYQDLNEKKVIFGLLPFFHAGGFVPLISNLFSSCTVIVLKRFIDRVFLRCIEKYQMTHLWIVPPLVLFLAKTPLFDEYDLSSVVEIRCGAAPLSKDVATFVRNKFKRGINFFQVYGLTEATINVLYHPNNSNVNNTATSGKVLPGMMLRIRDPNTGKSLGPNVVGELCIKGPMVMKGYYENDLATKEAFDDDNWLLTGDLGYYDNDEYFYVVGRLKELIKYKGFQVSPSELEGILLTHPMIKDAAVIGLPNDDVGELSTALIVKQPDSTLKEIDVVQYVADRLSHTKQLHGGVVFANEIPKSAAGKILRTLVKEIIVKHRKCKL